MKTSVPTAATLSRFVSTGLVAGAILLAAVTAVRAAAPTVQVLSPECPAWADLSKPADYIVAGIDPDNDLSHCDLYVNGAIVQGKNFTSPTSGTTCAFSYTFNAAGSNTISFQAVDKQNHYSSGVRCSVVVVKPPLNRNLRVLTFNAHLFEDSPVECVIRCADTWTSRDVKWTDYTYYDEDRRYQIAAHIRSSGADIVAVQEVWAYGYRYWMADVLDAGSPSYPYNYWYLDSSIDAQNGYHAFHAGLPVCIPPTALLRLPVEADRDRMFNTLGCGLLLLSKYPLSQFDFRRFPTYTQSPLDEADKSDTWADKGVLTAHVDVGGTPIRIGVSHALCGWDDYFGEWGNDYVADAMTTFQHGGQAFMVAINKQCQGQITRFEDYSYFNPAAQATDYGAGWKHVSPVVAAPDCAAAASFEMGGDPFLFGLGTNGSATVSRINDDLATGWTTVCSNIPIRAETITAFKVGGHPYVLGLDREEKKAYVLRINDDPATGATCLRTNTWEPANIAIASFELDGQPYLFDVDTMNQARISRINADPSTGWTHLHTNAWDSTGSLLASFQLGGSPHLFALTEGGNARISRINANPSTGWTHLCTNKWGTDSEYVAVKSFEMNRHPYLFVLRNCCEQGWDVTRARRQPGRAFLTRINEDGRGWENLRHFEDIKMIRDATIDVEDGPPAIMMGDFNIDRNEYGLVNEIFHQAGAVDAYVKVHGTGEGGETVSTNNVLYRYFYKDGSDHERIDYVYVKQSGNGAWLVPTNATVIRNWQMPVNHEDLSDHYPVRVDFRLQEACRLEAAQVPGGSLQFSIQGTIGRNCELQFSSDLLAWERLAEFRLTAAPHVHTDPAPATAARRFYRVQLLP